MQTMAVLNVPIADVLQVVIALQTLPDAGSLFDIWWQCNRSLSTPLDSADKKVILNQRIGWISYIKSWVPSLPGVPTLPSLDLIFRAYFGTPTPKAPVKKAQRYELKAFQDFRDFIDKTLTGFPAMIQLFPEADGESEILNEFEKLSKISTSKWVL